jgi:RNA polymerase sigma factor (sigma-70 family)
LPEGENHDLPAGTNESWRTWLMTGNRRNHVDRRRMRGENRGLKKILLEGLTDAAAGRRGWTDFSGAMVRHAVDDAMQALPEEDHHVVKLAYFGGYSNREIAAVVGLTEGTVQRRLRRALAAISDHIQHGRDVGRRAFYVVAAWLSGRWLADAAGHALPVTAIAAASVIILAQPSSTAPESHQPAPAHVTAPMPQRTVVPPVPSPSVPVVVQPPSVQVPAVNPPAVPPVQLPPLPTLPPRLKNLL